MSSYSLTVHENLSKLEDEDLIERIRAGSLTDEAQQVAARILGERGIEAPTCIEPSAEVETTPKKPKVKESDGEFLSRCFRGTASLSDVFWTLGFGIWIAIGIPASLLKSTPVSWLGGIALLAALIFRDIAIWRCAPNAKRVFWGIAARVWVFLGYGVALVAFMSK